MPAQAVSPDRADHEEWLGVAEFADEIGVKVDTMRSWIRRGEGPPAYKIGALVRIKRSDANAWIEGRRRD